MGKSERARKAASLQRLALCRLVGRVLRKVERQLQAQLQHILVALLTGPSSGSPLRASLTPLILQVSLCMAQVQGMHFFSSVVVCLSIYLELARARTAGPLAQA